MRTRKKNILKNAVSFFRSHEGYAYENALQKVSDIILSGHAENNPLFQQVIEADLPSDTAELHKILTPSAAYD